MLSSGVAVDDIAGGRDEVWEQAISKLKKRFTFGHWGSGKEKILSSSDRASSRWILCALDSLIISRVWTLCPSEN